MAATKRFTVALADEELGVFDTDELTVNDALVFENSTGITFNEMLSGLSDRSKPVPVRALVWFMRYKQGTPVDLMGIDFKLNELVTTAADLPDPTVAASRRGKNATKTSATSPTSAT